MSGLLLAGATCALLALDTSLEATSDGWVEHSTYEVISEGDCHRVDVVLPPGASLGEHRARLLLSDDSRRRLPEARWEHLDTDLGGTSGARLHFPEARRADRIRLEVERLWSDPGTFRWRPGLDAPTAATLALPKRQRATSFGDVDPIGREWLAVEPGPDVEVRVHRADPAAVPPPPPASTAGLSAEEAWSGVADLVLLPRGVDGQTPLWGEAAMARGAVDDRGFARTVALLAGGGDDQVEVGRLLPTPHREGLLDVEVGEVAVWHTEAGPVPLVHPQGQIVAGRAWTPSGIVELPSVLQAGSAIPPRGRVRIRRHLELVLPSGDPLVALVPGGGSSVRTTEALTFPPAGTARPWRVAMATDRGPVSAEGDLLVRGGTARERPDGVVIVAPPEGGTLVLQWETPDAPTWGVVPEVEGADIAVTVDTPGGEILWERDSAWVLARYQGQVILPDRDHLIYALERRFAALSIPEPGLPARIRSMDSGWDLAGALRSALLDRVRVDRLPGDPLWPRRLLKARGTEVVTPVEAALIVRLFALQSKLAADWVLVRPAREGPGWEVVPTGWTEGLVRVHWEGETRWVDPACEVCGPFEVRPHLEGADALGLVDRTPEPTPGAWEVRRMDGVVHWTLVGPPALLLRQEMRAIPQDIRARWLAEQVAGRDAELLEVVGVAEGGATIRISARGTEGIDPLDLSIEAADGWLEWVGGRTLVTAGEAEDAEITAGPLTWARTSARGEVVETLSARERAVSPADAARVTSIR